MGESGSASWLKRTVFGFGLLVVLAICAALAANYYFRKLGIEHLKSAIAEADKSDLGWRWEDLQKNRAVVPDGENAALRLEAAYTLLPKDWLNEGSSPDHNETTLLDALRELEPAVQLDDNQTNELRGRLKTVQSALFEARSLEGLRTGRFPPLAPETALAGMESQQHPRAIANLLWLDAALLAHDKQADTALTSCRALLNTGRSIGDEPLIIPHLVRIACQRVALAAIERTLAQEQASEKALASTQELLVDEANQPILLYALRGERALGDALMEWMETGDARGFGGTGNNGMSISNWVGGGWLTANRAQRLTFMTQAVRIGKLPAEEQSAQFQELDRKMKALPQDSRTMIAGMSVPAVIKMADSFRRSRAELRCAITALAVERYRLAHGHWPEQLEQLLPQFLPEVSVDPYDRKPLRFKRLEEGVLIYGLGPDGQDHGGKIERKKYGAPGDLGFQLWNVDRRRQPPSP